MAISEQRPPLLTPDETRELVEVLVTELTERVIAEVSWLVDEAVIAGVRDGLARHHARLHQTG